MASFVQRLVRKQTTSRTLITNLNNRILSSPTNLPDLKPGTPAAQIPFLVGIPKATDESNPNPRSSVVYPSFAFEAFLNPISQFGYVQSVVAPEEDVVSGDDERRIWADSVKKKRKKKMNKHKLKKLRKRLRRKT